jgi:hypothetical protein
MATADASQRMKQSISAWLGRVGARTINALTEHRERHGIAMSMYIEAAPLSEADLWPRLEQALDLIAAHRSIWLERMRRAEVSVHVRRIPGLRARLQDGRFAILDPYLLADFEPAQIAASVVHEAMHAEMQARGLSGQMTRAREERICRRAELRLGRALTAASVPGAEAVIERAAAALEGTDDEVAPQIDRNELRVIGIVTRISDLPVPRWFKRVLARKLGVIDTPQANAAFGKR